MHGRLWTLIFGSLTYHLGVAVATEEEEMTAMAVALTDVEIATLVAVAEMTEEMIVMNVVMTATEVAIVGMTTEA